MNPPFGPDSGQDRITDFSAEGAGRDQLRFSASSFTSLGDVLRHTSMADGSATIHIDAQDSVLLQGVAKAELWAHPHAIRLV